MPSNKWEEAIHELLNGFMQQSIVIHANDSLGGGKLGAEAFEKSIDQAKLALTNAVKELVVTAKPYSTKYDAAKALRAGTYKRGQEQYHGGYNQALDTYQANLLKAIGDKS